MKVSKSIGKLNDVVLQYTVYHLVLSISLRKLFLFSSGQRLNQVALINQKSFFQGIRITRKSDRQ